MPLERLLAVQRPAVYREPPIGPADDAHVGCLLVLVRCGLGAWKVERAQHRIMLHVACVDLQVVRAVRFERTRVIDVHLRSFLLFVFLHAEPDRLASARRITIDAVRFAVENKIS